MTNKSPTGCRSEQLFGLWFIAPEALDAYRERAVAIDFESLARMNAEADTAEVESRAKAGGDSTEPPPKPYAIEDGVAVINVSGPTTKYRTSYSRILGGTSTMMVERALSQAAQDDEVRSILLHFDSAPGGTVAGAYELFDRIYALRGRGKPIVAHGSDQMTSAAYLFAAACDHVTANRNGIVGSIGTRAQLVDTSEKLKRDGIRVIPIASGKYKAAGLPGTPVSVEHVADFQRQIDAMNDQFVADVVRGRAGRLDERAVRRMEARCYVGREAVSNRLIDGVASFEDVLASLKQHNVRHGASGTPGALITLAAPNPQRRIPMTDLLSEIRDLFGAADMTEEQAAARVRSLKAESTASTTKHATMQADNDRLRAENDQAKGERPKPADPDVLRDRADALAGKFDAMVTRQEITPVLATKLKDVVAKDGKPNEFWLTRQTAIDARPIDVVTGLFAGEKLGGPPAGSQTNPQLLNRETPGAGAAGGDDAKAIEQTATETKAYVDAELLRRGIK